MRTDYNPTPMERWDDLYALQKHYVKFEDFLWDVITELLGFTCTDIQIDIGQYLAYGPKHKMVQAQRGQAKTTITAIYAVWRLIHEPRSRILIVSAGDGMATEIANWIIQIIEHMDELECLRPDTGHGDRSSVKAFDVHYVLKGAEKSPSIACMGITSNIQGKRADILIADDIESAKNSMTAVQRERLKHLTKDFTSICSTGEIIYLGTPQNNDSVYLSLPSRGYDIRIWPGRYPTPEEMDNYGQYLAPLIRRRIEENPSLQGGGGPLGDRGQAVDPDLLNEEVLIKKEIDQGRAYFQLQHMLDTKLTDADRYPLKTHKLILMPVPRERVPILINPTQNEEYRILPPQGFPLQEKFFKAISTGEEFGEFTGTHMYVDPSGGGKNGDELAYAVTKFLAGNVFVVASGGIPGGLGDDKLQVLTDVAVKWKPHQIDIEENFGKGALRHIWTPKLLKALKEINHSCAIEDVWESGQKELRIIDVLEPVIGSGRLVVDEELLFKDWEQCQRYPAELRVTYSLFFQLARITREKGALIHDDRLDALAGSVRHWVELLALDSEKQAAKIRNDNYAKLISNPLGNGRSVPGLKAYSEPNSTHKFRRPI